VVDPLAVVRAVVRALPIALPTLVLASFAIGGIYAKLHHAGAPLDDSYIHFQYARAFAELHPFRYQAGEPFTTGATSFLWPALLAPFHALGARDELIVWPAWVLSFVALGLLAHEALLLTRPLAGRAASVGAAAMVLAFSGFAWCAASGMEVVPFAWLLARGARRSSEWAESAKVAEPRGPRLSELVVLAFAAPLMRPEGAIASWTIAATLLVFCRGRWPPRGRQLAAALAALAAPLVPFALGYALTGELRGSTATVKLMLGNPYYGGRVLEAAVGQNVRVLFGTLFNGEIWSAEFLPKGGVGVALAGFLSIGIRGWQARTRWRALCILVIAASILVPCSYVTFLWNRLRYLWPFATGWLIGLACLARLFGEALGRVHARWRVATPLLCGGMVACLAGKLGWTLDDVADSASGIDRQQVLLGRWARENLPADARIGVNDTGAIAYLSDRHTFDIVGLTTRGEGRYWVAGVASRFEHYERLYAKSPALLPTHFIVYPEWMACNAILGTALFEATVDDATILGGTTMRVYEADYGRLGSGEMPWTPMGSIKDSLDVADLESETEHAYDLDGGLGAADGQEVLHDGVAPDGHAVVDGGRGHRWRERFVLATGRGASRGVVRLQAAEPALVQVLVDGAPVAELDAPEGDWGERSFPLPAAVRARAPVELRVTGGAVTVYHYWFE
jgi:hypothetical protein